MSDINDLVQTCMIKPAHIIKRICNPLMDKLAIPIFGFCRIEQNGNYCNLSNFPEPLDFFYKKKLYLSQPYLRDPNLFQSGYTVIRTTNDIYHQSLICSNYELNYMFVILKRVGEHMEFYFFAYKNLGFYDCLVFLNQLHLLVKFTDYFKREAKPLIDKSLTEGYNIKQLLGKMFHKADPTLPLLRHDLKTEQFLKSISPLSPREHQCLELFKQGYSAQATAAMLFLSQRTVEHYFESIKNKLGCYSKWELLNC